MKRPLPDDGNCVIFRASRGIKHHPNFRSANLIAQSETGFTLVELVLVILLLSIVSAVAAIPLMEGARAYISTEVRTDLTNQGRLAIERMAREIRTIRSRTAADLPGCCNAVTLSFVDTAGNAIVYTSDGVNITRNGVVLASAGAVTLNFSYFQQDGVTAAGSATQVWTIQVDMTDSRGGESQAYRIRVHPRNI